MACCFLQYSTMMTLRSKQVEVICHCITLLWGLASIWDLSCTKIIGSISESYIFHLYKVSLHLWMWLGESNIWRMTTTNNLSSFADWCAQFTFFFSTIPELQLSVRWPNPIGGPYGHSNVISKAFILCLLLDWEGALKRWHLNWGWLPKRVSHWASEGGI